MPDDELFAAAAADDLLTPEEIEDQARRLLAHANARETITTVFAQWLGIDAIDLVVKDAQKFPDFDNQLRTAMATESRTFIENLLWEDDASLENLFTARYTFVNDRLASFYGIGGVSGANFVKVALGANRAAGILGHGSVLASHASPTQSSPVLRGLFVRTQILCQEQSPPPPELIVTPPDPQPGLTTRELYAEHTENPSCYTCHKNMDPIGFGFEHFDSVGLFRDTERGKPIDASGELLGTTNIDGKFYGLDELGARLATSTEVQRCVANQLFRYAFARMESDLDVYSIDSLVDAVESAGLLELIVQLTQTDTFRYLKLDSNEEGQ